MTSRIDASDSRILPAEREPPVLLISIFAADLPRIDCLVEISSHPIIFSALLFEIEDVGGGFTHNLCRSIQGG